LVIVLIASVAGQAGTCQLTDYCSSKFAAVGFEESLRLELLNANMTGIKSTIVMPYFINTGMFDGFKSPILPALQPDVVADEIISGVLSEAEHVVVPKILYVINTLKTMLPTKAYYKLYEALGGFEVMSDFTGRQNTTDNNNQIDNNNRKVK
jgi:all-trans-retinol dehydrogenase (NAD+)